MIIGYARTSTREQLAGLEAQVRDLRAAGAEKVYEEHASSMDDTRLAWRACRDFIREGDVLVVTKPDRVARSVTMLLATLAGLEAQGIGLVILSMGGERLDTRNPTSRLMLTILGAVAGWEREIMLERQREGIAKAKAEGKYKGRAPTALRQADEVKAAIARGERPTAVAKRLGMSRSSVYTAMRYRVAGVADASPSMASADLALDVDAAPLAP